MLSKGVLSASLFKLIYG
ncbi:hypothetical protein LAY16_02315 [Escherichia coli]|nr:hypothetical protein [Escherichia coli]